MCEGKNEAGRGHQEGADDEHAPAADAIGACGQIQRNDRVPDEGKREQQSRLRFAQSEANQIEDEHDGKRTVSEQASKTRGEEQPRVARQNFQRFRHSQVDILVLLLPPTQVEKIDAEKLAAKDAYRWVT